MTKENLVPCRWARLWKKPSASSKSTASKSFLVVDQDFNLKGLITVKDIQKKLEYPHSAKMNRGACG